MRNIRHSTWNVLVIKGRVINQGEGENWKIVDSKLFAPPPQNKVKLFTPPFKGEETFCDLNMFQGFG